MNIELIASDIKSEQKKKQLIRTAFLMNNYIKAECLLSGSLCLIKL